MILSSDLFVLLLWQEEEETKPQLAGNDPREIKLYYKNFYEKNIKDSEDTRKPWALS